MTSASLMERKKMGLVKKPQIRWKDVERLGAEHFGDGINFHGISSSDELSMGRWANLTVWFGTDQMVCDRCVISSIISQKPISSPLNL